ncbi:hypothetical protein ACHAWF_003321, partial [Thalassiosira exigua]
MFSPNHALSNALNLFPATSTPQRARAKLDRLLAESTGNARGATEVQIVLAATLYDDDLNYMSTLDMNRAASYTFGRTGGSGGGTIAGATGAVGVLAGMSVAEEMWELLLDLTLGKFLEHSTLALTKALHLIRHALIHGSEACVTDATLLRRIASACGPLRDLNTAIAEQRVVEQILNDDGRSGALERDLVLDVEGIARQLGILGARTAAMAAKLRGGSVDRGRPVREAATALRALTSDANVLWRERARRNDQFGSASLVPVGDARKAGYITDEGRRRVLERKVAAAEEEERRKAAAEERRLRQTRSNLAG